MPVLLVVHPFSQATILLILLSSEASITLLIAQFFAGADVRIRAGARIRRFTVCRILPVQIGISVAGGIRTENFNFDV